MFGELPFKIEKIEGELSEILKAQNFDYIVTDVSTSLLDIIFFKNKAIYFSPKLDHIAYKENIYSKFLTNLSNVNFKSFDKLRFENCPNINQQECLLSFMIKEGDNSIINL